MMRHLVSDSLGDLAAIYDKDVELVCVERAESNALAVLAQELFATRTVIQSQWEQKADNDHALGQAVPSLVDNPSYGALNEEILGLADVLTTLLDCERVGVRVTTLHRPMCPRFHVDNIPCRLLTTISGPGTQWISNEDVDWERLADRGDDSLPVHSGKTINQFESGSWSLLKGGSWDENFAGVVHRSPHAGGERLLLSIDPIFSS